MSLDPALRERSMLLVLLGVQFTHFMDFMVLMPLGPQFIRIWQITPTEFAILVSAYTLSAAVASVLCGLYVDRFDRKRALLFLYGGFTISTLLCAAAPDYAWLLAARSISGAFGGIAGAAVYSIVGDVIPDARRGTAMGIVMTAFPISAVAGVPLGLTLANAFDWRAPFTFLAVVSTLVFFTAAWLLPRMDAHVVQARSRHPIRQAMEVLSDNNQVRALTLTAVMIFGGFSVIPFIAPYMVANVGLAETDLPWLYLFGGAATVFTSRLWGRMSDRRGKHQMFTIISGISIFPLLACTNLPPVPVWVAVLVMVTFMIFVSGRFVPAMAIVTGAAQPDLRGAFLSFNSATQQFGSSAASLASGFIIDHTASGRLTGYWISGLIAVGCTILAIRLARDVRIVN
ncbi:MAG: MFS transporter [Betaproteobacteria bacterium]|jgi:predicted MFS family arabinose efflux permease|nr:MAG: MFS transporter [Betaproteobacteria bacterium]